jgi:hypothetical protein
MIGDVLEIAKSTRAVQSQQRRQRHGYGLAGWMTFFKSAETHTHYTAA